ncbi:formate dehydrogenase accessory sulfurtransferase FdhD [Planctomonas sp. JC2975]|uniref:formate dehydrogenase accessory sulfurtransferase FdhD n=1 Tax=Planctomonas sp. JC2975 TaxID=2729626 RepID=UPI001474E864|nr:formate dehydrogenase accessory sulfurtransferase FdhD [Planctomonas sp. JC2975]NNC11381.1 formate dehydrogenase accessory sulfurtransferase FdhD [Planctomonas sp. JC2975]
MGRVTTRRRVARLTIGAAIARREDTLVVEEPLEIRVGGRSLAVTMRTPGNDVELAAGFLVSEGVIHRGDDFATARFCAGEGVENTYNVLDVTLGPGVAPPSSALAREFFTTSSCGICGKSSIDAVRTSSAFEVRDDQVRVPVQTLVQLPDRLRAAQDVFEKTGGLHAACLYRVADDELMVVREDVGRHNAVDKVVGWALTHDLLPLTGTVLMVSGRASFELTQKALMAGIPMLAAVSAPSSLAVELAIDAGMSLIGFVRGDSMVVYAGGQRVDETCTEGSAA